MRIPFKPTIRWDDEASAFIDALVDSDIRYLDLPSAIEKVFEGKEYLAVSEPFVLDGRIHFLHRTPPFLNLPTLYVTFDVLDEGQLINILEIRFARESLQ